MCVTAPEWASVALVSFSEALASQRETLWLKDLVPLERASLGFSFPQKGV